MTARLATAQAVSQPGDLARNTTRAGELMMAAGDCAADVVVLPELFLSGYDLPGLQTAPDRYAVELGDHYCDELAQAARDANVTAVVGAAVQTASGLANAALIVCPKRGVIDAYAKVHLWGAEKEIFSPGDRLLAVERAGVKFGIAICYDVGFPEHIRQLVLAGADAIVSPSAFAEGEEHRRYDLYFPMRALENTVYVAVSNALGRQGGLEMFGESRIYGPDGHLEQQVAEGSELEVTAISLARLQSVRDQLPYLENRHTSLPPVQTIHDKER
jgi:predicted amidohydrolase